MRVEKNSRLRSGYECCCYCCCCCVCVLCALRQSCNGCQSTPPGRVVQCVRGACCAVCVARSHSPEPRARLLFSLTAAKDKSTQNTRVACCSSHPANHPPHDFGGLSGGLALAWSRHTGHAFGEIVAWCGANHLPCEPALLAVAICWFLPHAMYSIARDNSGSPGQQDYCSIPN